MAASIELFLSPDGGDRQSLDRGLGDGALAVAGDGSGAPKPRTRGPRAENYLDAGGDQSSLPDQGWGVIAPDGEVGDRLLALARPLIDQRAADQRGEVAVYRAPPGLTATSAAAWIDRKVTENALHAAIPGYLLVLGGPDHVSFELQQVLATGFSVGRLGFDDEPGKPGSGEDRYGAYIAKLLASERAPALASSRAVYFTARDGTPATDLGRRLLMQPCIADAEQQRSAGQFAASEIAAIEDADPARAADRLAAAAASPGVMFSCSHGAGAPIGGWESPARRRAEQGALCLGGGERLDAGFVARAPFVPGGVWVMFACFGAGTPTRSAYHHWLARLQARGEHDGDLAPVLASLPAEGEPAFLAALPQAALASPGGPLAVIGHLDLAWSYGFVDLDKMSRGERHRRFHELIAQLVKGTRVGLALGSSLMRARNQVQAEVTAHADAAFEQGGAVGPSSEAADPQARIGHRWMVMQDLAGYIALGDPAARLAVAQREARDRRGGDRSEPPAPPIELRTATPAASPDAAAIEAAVLDLLADRATAAELAARLGVTAATVEDWRRVYTEAGRRAVGELAASAGSSTR